MGGPDSRRVAVLFNDSTERMHTEIALREAKEVADKANRAKNHVDDAKALINRVE